MEIGGKDSETQEIQHEQVQKDTAAQVAASDAGRQEREARPEVVDRVSTVKADGELRRAAHIRAFADYLDGRIDACQCVDLIHNIYENAIAYRNRSRGT